MAGTEGCPGVWSVEDQRLLEEARAGDPEAFGALCEPLEARLYRQAFALCGHGPTAEELAQETLLAAWKGIGQFRGKCRLFTWLCGILIRVGSQRRRREARRPLLAFFHADSPELSQVHAESGGPAGGMECGMEVAERDALVRRCLDRLPEKHRQVVYLRFYVDNSLEGIAATLGCSAGTVKSRLFHALKKLSQMRELQPLLRL